MARATDLLNFYEALYRCVDCGYTESSEDMTPKDQMSGSQALCSRCGEITQAIWGMTSLSPKMLNPDMEM